MSRITLVDTPQNETTENTYAEIKSGFGMVPNLFKALANNPQILKANWEKLKAVMMQGDLPRDVKEMIAVVVSKANACQYCVDAHGNLLKMIGVPREKVLQIIANIDSANIDPATKTVLNFSVKATREPSKITDEDVQAIKDLGYNDSQLVELLSVIDLFTSFNIFLLAGQVDIDFPEV
jgi:uncharacterized peroxidase-related enzyme